MNASRLGAILLVGGSLALGCGRYGSPIRPEPKPEAAPPAEESAPEDAGETDDPDEIGEPDFRLNLPGIRSDGEDE